MMTPAAIKRFLLVLSAMIHHPLRAFHRADRPKTTQDHKMIRRISIGSEVERPSIVDSVSHDAVFAIVIGFFEILDV